MDFQQQRRGRVAGVLGVVRAARRSNGSGNMEAPATVFWNVKQN
jgi:hypothetical protein